MPPNWCLGGAKLAIHPEDSCPDIERHTLITGSPDTRGFQESEVCGALEGTPCQAGCACLPHPHPPKPSEKQWQA
eukprot:1033414-Pelagomonas_calceolata.AAC.6